MIIKPRLYMSSIFFRVFRSEGELTLGSGSSSGRAGGFSELRMDGREFGGEEKRTFENLIQQFLLPWIAFTGGPGVRQGTELYRHVLGLALPCHVAGVSIE